MMDEKACEFTSSTQYKSKLSSQKRNLFLQLQKDYLNDLLSLMDDGYKDIDIHIGEDDVHLRHRCVINTICPLLLLNNLNINEPSDETIYLDKYPDDIHEYEKKFIKHIYGRDDSHKFFDDINTEINFDSLLEDGSYSDIVFKVGDQKFKCHKCILSSRCEYFARMFNGNWKEKEQDIVELKDVSPQTFKYILSFIYSDRIDIPKDVDLTELLFIADMYGINSIKSVVSFYLKAHCCYFFIAPYDVCISGAIRSLEISKMFNLNELKTECYDWFVKSYLKIFSHRNFSKMSLEVKNDIVEKIKEDISPITIVHHLKDCNKLKSCLPTVKWGQSMRTLVEQMEDYCLEFVCNNFDQVVNQPAFQYCLFNEKDINPTLMVQELFVSGVTKYISKDNCIDIYKSTKMIDDTARRFDTDAFNNIPNKKEAIDNCNKFVSDLQDLCKKFIGKNIFHIQKMKKWKLLKKDVQEHLLSSSGFISMDEPRS